MRKISKTGPEPLRQPAKQLLAQWMKAVEVEQASGAQKRCALHSRDRRIDLDATRLFSSASEFCVCVCVLPMFPVLGNTGLEVTIGICSF